MAQGTSPSPGSTNAAEPRQISELTDLTNPAGQLPGGYLVADVPNPAYTPNSPGTVKRYLTRRVAYADLVQLLQSMGAATNGQRGTAKIVLYASSSTKDIGPYDTTLDRLPSAVLCVGTEATVLLPYGKMVLARDPTGPLTVATDGSFLGPTTQARWTTPAEAFAAGEPAFDPLTAEYPAEARVNYRINGTLRLFSAVRLLRRVDFPLTVIPPPGSTEEWEEVSPPTTAGVSQQYVDDLHAEQQVAIDDLEADIVVVENEVMALEQQVAGLPTKQYVDAADSAIYDYIDTLSTGTTADEKNLLAGRYIVNTSGVVRTYATGGTALNAALASLQPGETFSFQRGGVQTSALPPAGRIFTNVTVLGNGFTWNIGTSNFGYLGMFGCEVSNLTLAGTAGAYAYASLLGSRFTNCRLRYVTTTNLDANQANPNPAAVVIFTDCLLDFVWYFVKYIAEYRGSTVSTNESRLNQYGGDSGMVVHYPVRTVGGSYPDPAGNVPGGTGSTPAADSITEAQLAPAVRVKLNAAGGGGEDPRKDLSTDNVEGRTTEIRREGRCHLSNITLAENAASAGFQLIQNNAALAPARTGTPAAVATAINADLDALVDTSFYTIRQITVPVNSAISSTVLVTILPA